MAVQGFQADGTALVKLVKQRLEVSGLVGADAAFWGRLGWVGPLCGTG